MKKKQKAIMGRPPKPKSKKQNARIMLNVTPADKKILEKDARLTGKSLSAYLFEAWQKFR